jgi:hypothetical protein
MSTVPSYFRSLLCYAGMVCAVLLFLGCPVNLFASCGDYLQGHRAHAVTNPAQHAPRDPAPMPPCRCQGVECQQSPRSPLPTELPIPRGILQSAWWLNADIVLSDNNLSPSRVDDEVYDSLTVSTLEHVPIAPMATGL